MHFYSPFHHAIQWRSLNVVNRAFLLFDNLCITNFVCLYFYLIICRNKISMQINLFVEAENSEKGNYPSNLISVKAIDLIYIINSWYYICLYGHLVGKHC